MKTVQTMHRSSRADTWCWFFFFTWDSGAQEVEEFAVLGVHDGPLDELHHGVAAVLKLGVTPQAERPWRSEKRCCSLNSTYEASV